jgi:hypothetical protein
VELTLSRKRLARKSLPRKGKKRLPSPPIAEFPPEERRAEAATVAWMLCALCTFCAEGLGLIARITLAYSEEGELQPSAWSALPDVTLLVALVTGTLCLVLTPIVYRLGRTAPPAAITVVAILLGLTPWATLALQWLRA